MSSSDPAAKRPRRNPSRQADPVETYNFRKVTGAKSSDYFCNIITLVTTRHYRNPRHMWCIPADPSYSREMLPTCAVPENPMTALCTQWINTVYNYDAKGRDGMRRAQFTQMLWTPGGRRMISATTHGDFVLWNGHSYNIESRTIAHEDAPCRCLVLAPVNDLIISADDKGVVKFWQLNLNCVRRFEAHTSGGNAIRDLALAPSEAKLATAGKDGTVRVWDMETQKQDARMEGHGSDVSSVSWHPTLALMATGSLDKDVRLWDPRSPGNHLGTIQGHANGVNKVRFNAKDGNMLLSCSKDNTIKLWDTRTLGLLAVYHGHTKEPTAVEWHPHHTNLFASCGLDGTLAYWIVGFGEATQFKEGRDTVNRWVAAVPKAHGEFRGTPTPILDIKWHPLGHVIASASWDGRVWTRNQPGTEIEVRFNEAADTSFDMTTTAEQARRMMMAAGGGGAMGGAMAANMFPSGGGFMFGGGAGNMNITFGE